jgi:DNA sulfur modification protein DndC
LFDFMQMDRSAEVIAQIQSLLAEVNIVSFSGGKDSTTVLQHVLAAMQATDKKLFIVNSDTLMEIPYFQAYVDKAKQLIRNYIQGKDLNAEVITVRPKLEHSFWVGVLGMGYPAAHMGFRWCTGRLKVDPITNFVRTATAGKKYMAFVGVRSAESALRAKIYKQKDFKPNHYAPILDWSSHDVWEYLLTEPCPWGDHVDLVNVYKYSSDECVYGEAQGVCVGNARYGCWACPLQTVSQLNMIGAHTGEVFRYRELRRFKEKLVAMANKKGFRSRIRRNGSVGAGPFLVSIRKLLYDDLKQVESATGWTLITPEEESFIFNHWNIDADIHNIPDRSQMTMWESSLHG